MNYGAQVMTNNAERRPRVLMLAYACHPGAGSEPGVGWNRAIHAAQQFEVCVLCDEHNRPPIEKYLSVAGPIPHLEFVFVPSSRWERVYRYPMLFYPLYNRWHRRAYKIARNLHARFPFDLAHQLTFCGFREPGYLWKLGVPFVWGPVGGVQNFPWRFLPAAGMGGAIREALRNVVNVGQLHLLRRVRRAARTAKVLLAANTTNARALAPLSSTAPRLMLDAGVNLRNTPRQHNFQHGGPLRLLWSGVFEHRKALHLLLQSLASLPQTVPFELRILRARAAGTSVALLGESLRY